jgi:hypothetical protein
MFAHSAGSGQNCALSGVKTPAAVSGTLGPFKNWSGKFPLVGSSERFVPVFSHGKTAVVSLSKVFSLNKNQR